MPWSSTRSRRTVAVGAATMAALVIALGAVVWGTLAQAAQTSDTTVEIKGFAFNPAEVRIAASGTATRTNADGAAHTVSAVDGPFDSGRLAPGGTFTLEAATLAPGTYAYQCNIHTGMTGTLIIE